mmetsp:Transcript_5750/g.14359  ORF Transcript_5750/g.14359 Transcript_5750/m.14359 type:complete len:352 (+) Transcript_5750:107-1162(+)
MASWFTSAALSDKINSLKDKVQTQVNNIDPDLIKKLTLQSDELVSERQRIDEEERRKETVRDSLAEILPWETRDAEMEILVDECKEVILGLSSKNDTFIGPFVLTGGLPAATGEEAGDEDEDKDDDENDPDRKVAKDVAAAEASAEKLSKLQPLPALLANFDLDTHVGLIQRLLKVDPKLVEMHSRLSSGGQRELVFWKNYFFHCAYTRYEAGLSIDEIWSNEPRDSRPAPVADELEDDDIVNINEPDEEVIFDSASTATSIESGSDTKGEVMPGTNISDAQLSNNATATQTSVPIAAPSTPQRDAAPKPDAVVSPDSGGTDYEFVANAGGDGDDGEMDELEAEIAAALGD